MNGLSASGLADLAGTTAAEVQRLVDLGILVARDGTDPFLETDVQKVRLAAACERAGLPMEAIASAIRAGRLSFAFLEASPFRRWAVRSGRTYRQVSQETEIPGPGGSAPRGRPAPGPCRGGRRCGRGRGGGGRGPHVLGQ